MTKRFYKDTPVNRTLLKAREERYIKGTTGWTRLNKCSAWYIEDGDFVWLLSYTTIVACFNKYNDVLVSFGRYSNTTYMHVRKFRNEVCYPIVIRKYMTGKPHEYLMERNMEYENWF